MGGPASDLPVTLRVFSHYSSRALDHLADPADYSQTSTLKMILPDYEASFLHYDLPLAVRIGTTSTTDIPFARDFVMTYQVDVNANRMFLHKHLESSQRDAFSFLKPSPALRNPLYEMLLSFHGGRLVMVGGQGAARFYATRRTCAVFAVRNLSRDDVDQMYSVPNLPDMLSILATCKQIYREAIPFFYHDNSFVFSRTRFKANNTYGLLAARSQHLSNLSIMFGEYRYDYPDETHIRALASFLTTKQPPRRLVIRANSDAYWFVHGEQADQGRYLPSGTRPYDDYSQIPGFDMLIAAIARAEEFVIIGDCPRLAACVDAKAKDIISSSIQGHGL